MEDVVPDLTNLRRSARRGEKRQHENEDLVGALFALGDKILKGNETMGQNFIKFHELEQKRKQDDAEKKKRQKTDDELLESDPIETEFEGLKLGDDCRTKINPTIRSKLLGPFTDPQVWWVGDFNNDKPAAVVGDGLFYTHIMVSLLDCPYWSHGTPFYTILHSAVL